MTKAELAAGLVVLEVVRVHGPDKITLTEDELRAIILEAFATTEGEPYGFTGKDSAEGALGEIQRAS